MTATLGRFHDYRPVGNVLSLKVIGYESPSIRDRWDDWLMIFMLASDGTRRWWSVSAAFTTWELQELVAWLRNVAAGIPSLGGWRRHDESPTDLGRFKALEPKLGFMARRADASIELIARLSHQFHPDYGSGPGVPEPIELRFQVSDRQVERFADRLEAELSSFPVRLNREPRPKDDERETQSQTRTES